MPGARAWIGSFTSAGGPGVVAAEVDPATGTLTPTGASHAVPDPSYLALGPDGTVLYAVSETADGAVAAFDVSGPAPCPLAPPRPVQGAAPTHLALAHGHLLTAHYTSGGVSTLLITADGTPGPVSGLLRHRGSGPDPERQTGPHAHQVVAAPGGLLLLSTDLGTDSVRIAALDPAAGGLRPHGETRLRAGTGPRHLAFHPDGRHVYVLCELTPVLVVCGWDAAAGTLEPLAELPLPGAGGYPSALVASPDGRFLWAAVRGDDTVHVLATGPAPGAPRPVVSVPSGGHWPRDLALHPSGRWLYAAHERSGEVTWLAVDPATGIPEAAGSIPVPAASCVVFG
ncbi:lactonase family protein [Streptomyces sp. LP05-1]|uniref:Lactonase family protein n=1 Tax=Streptomyces pyxinae TaxID=2970734 RepID=A0ABT2CHR7_9ACTN|nr:lactonase family protein [Streptomyces sp. LP05-1]MCS0636950.1 lactonase family protein [Streptomyces sp. LP05-1]